ncbi:hypothetical protein ASPBRDRAFT_416654 [Aspergillus brasiliensis CBS 101740]|uniref:SNF2 N-terminal domain-containing protein n=1 Tax=Aspergillus brasiliensis (strain CBS 101740 / IMI 381727 / IBT 21946) TaxID=767769 RepID=A0A1L9UYM8_ASPBC|nr:hypothetical protein ASPBRDRAFT_416654 [Aspergillus brasiliensis CBS 101740]
MQRDPNSSSVACYTFRIALNLGENVQYRIPIAGLQTKRDPLPYQVYGSIWMLVCEVTTYLRSGFLADDIGYGKTLMTILIVLTSRWIEIAIQRACANPYIGPDDTLCRYNTDLPI